MFATEYHDSSTFFNQFFTDPADHHHPLGLHVTQETYVWSHPAVDDFVGVELRIRNMSREIDGTGWTIEKPYVGMLVDGDVGVENHDQYWIDDHAAYREAEASGTRVRMGYMFDDNGGGDDITSFLGVMLLDQEVHAFRRWSGGNEDPRDDLDRYELLRGPGDDVQTIDPPTTQGDDYRFLISTGPFENLLPDESIVVRFAFVAGEMLADAPDLANPFWAQRVYDGFSTDNEQLHWAASLPPWPPNTRLAADNSTVPSPILVVPNPLRMSASGTVRSGMVRFRNLPDAADVRIYSIEGRLVETLAPNGAAEAAWSPKAAGVFLYSISTPAGAVDGGRLVVLR
jgi:hypothetical protein